MPPTEEAPVSAETWLRKNVKRLLDQVGDPAKCRGCQAEIYFVRLKSGKVAPYDETGESHFVTCPAANQFRRKKSE